MVLPFNLNRFGATQKKRPYYCEVEYLESTGTQYIDTGFKMSNDNMTFNGNIMWTQSNGSANFFYGYRSVNSAEYHGDMRAFFVYGASAPPAGRLAIRYGVNTDNSNSTISQNQKYNISFDGTNLKVDGTTLISVSSSYTPADYKNMYLFYCNCTGYYSADVLGFSGRIYNWQIKQDGVLVRDLIPVLDWDMTPCMYDRVSGQFFYNQGTGSFSYGREIHQVEYLENTSGNYANNGGGNSSNYGSYINTGIHPKPNGKVKIGIKFNDWGNNTPYQALFGAYDSNTKNFGIVVNMKSGTDTTYFMDGTQASQDIFNYDPDTYYDFEYIASEKSLSINGNTYTFSSVNPLSTQSNLSIYLFTDNSVGGDMAGYNTTYTMKGKIYYFKYYEGDTLIGDFIPAIDENGVGFMFDRVSHTCYLNAGQGSFKYPAREVEYLESTGTQYIDTDIKIDDTCGYDISWMALNADDRIIIGTKGSGDSRWCLSGNNNPFLNISWNSVFTSDGLELNKIQTAKMNYLNDRKRILNDTPLEDISTTLSSSASTYNVGIFAGYWGSSTVSLYSTCRIYYAKITKGTETIRDFIPVFQDGQAGMLDKQNNVFYPNNGTGNFATGKIIESRWF